MRQLQVIAKNLLGEIRWHSNVLGYAQCPGKDLHSNSPGPRDCRITIDGAPTIYCVHNSCAAVIGECNRRLRSNIAKATSQPKRWNNYKPQTSPEAIQNAKVMSILEKHAIDPKEIYQNSPDQLIGVSQPNLWRSFLGIFQLDDIVWIGDIKDSGSQRHSRHLFIVEANLRSLPLINPFTLRWNFPVFQVDPSIDKTKLKLTKSGRPSEYKIKQIVEVLGDDKLTSGEWSAKCRGKIGIGASRFHEFKTTAKVRGLVYQVDRYFQKQSPNNSDNFNKPELDIRTSPGSGNSDNPITL